ncbi:protein SENSITIVE TO UV 2 isoform X3 [Silene latifolia]|uniref:protein SENSITIVE TO UV 2 isoform X3 n=1 Tax=Silene latifolia TaxID=37657 RepID=UPI003D771683
MSAPEILLDDDVFDESFLKEIEQLEELATSSTQHHHRRRHHHQPPHLLPFKPSSSTVTSLTSPLPPPPPPPQLPPQHYFPSPAAADFSDNINYSPPRQLSQRFTNTTNPNVSNSTNSITSTRSSRSPVTPPNPEIDLLKSELSRVSKQLSDLKDECSMLRKERDKKEQHKFSSNTKTGSCAAEAPLMAHARIGISPKSENLNAVAGGGRIKVNIEQKSVGIQTDNGAESASPSISGTTSSFSGLPKLLTIWSSSRTSHRKFVAKLLETCATDFCALFGFLGLNMTSETVKECLTHKPLLANIVDPHSTEVTRVSQLYFVLDKLSNDMVRINDFVDVLLDLCELKNALLVHMALRILRVAVNHLLSTERIRSRRDNAEVERCHSGSDSHSVHDSEVGMQDISVDKASTARFSPALKNMHTVEHEVMTRIDWCRLFTSMCQTALTMSEERVKVEAVSIMNIILRGMDPYSERKQFGKRCVYEAVAGLLNKDAGLFCRNEVAHLVYLLLNYILTAFCKSCKEIEGDINSAKDGTGNFTYQASCAILEGLANCISYPGHSLKLQELSLCRSAILVLAFLASGKSGLDIFLFHKLANGGNFLGSILQVLVWEIDAETLDSNPAPEISRERTLLMREALILLNRLVSHPVYATTVLQVLTSSRDIVSLAIDSATRLSKRNHRLLNSDIITKQMRESEVGGLATLFKKRIVNFLGATT